MPLAPIKNRAKRHESKKARAMRRMRNLLIACVILAVVIGGAFVLLLWVMKPQAVKPVTTPAADSGRPMLAQQKLARDIPIGSAIQSITTPISPGDNASVTLRTTEDATCTIKVVQLDPYNKELRRITDSGLSDKVADLYGMVTWTWTMPEDATIATWKADMFCKRDSKSTRSVGDIVVKKQSA